MAHSLKSCGASITVHEKGSRSFCSWRFAARPPRSSAGCAAEGTHTLWNTHALWNSRSAPLASPAHAQLSPLLRHNSTHISSQFPRKYWKKATWGREGGGDPLISLLRPMEPPYIHPKGLGDNPVGLNQGAKGINP